MIEEENKTNVTEASETNSTEITPQPKKRSALAVRSLTAVFIAILYVAPILLSFFIDGHFYDALILFLSIAAGFEFVRALSVKYDKPIEAFVYIFILVGYGAFKLTYHFAIEGVGAASVYFIALAFVFVVCSAYAMFSKKYSVGNLISTLFAMIYPCLMLTYALLINYFEVSYAQIGILMLFIVTTLTDTMAYFVGSLVKGPKLCPTISPKKTISGAIGGLIGGTLGGVIVFFIANAGIFETAPFTAVKVANFLHFAFLGLGASLFCQIGDLVASYIKRAIGIKDYGKLLKGHGGFMDRIDGLMFSALFIFIYLTILGLTL